MYRQLSRRLVFVSPSRAGAGVGIVLTFSPLLSRLCRNFSLIFPFINEMIVEQAGVKVEDGEHSLTCIFDARKSLGEEKRVWERGVSSRG